ESSLSWRRRDLRARAADFSRSVGRGGGSPVPDRRHGAPIANRRTPGESRRAAYEVRQLFDIIERLPNLPMSREDVSMRGNVTRWALAVLTSGMTAFAPAALVAAEPEPSPPPRGGGANRVLPRLSTVTFLGFDGHTLLLAGILVCALGLLFGMIIYGQLRSLPVH